jgi:dTDP-4-dehydrorhamnose reductase
LRIGTRNRVLVTGASGSLGWTLAGVLATRCKTTATYYAHSCVPEPAHGVQVDFCEVWAAGRVIDQYRPDVTIHLAAITDPDRCERNPQLAFRVNFEAATELARACKQAGSRVVFMSTDLVFGGSKGDYTEEDIPRPLSIYGMSKLRAEEAIMQECGDALVMRGSLLYGVGSPVSKTFLTRILEKLDRGDKMELFTDQRRNPILVDDLAQAIIVAIEQDLYGLYHVGGSEALSRYDFGRKVCDAYGCDQGLLVPIRMQDFSYDARRPLDSTLNISKFVRATGFVPSKVSDGLVKVRGRR